MIYTPQQYPQFAQILVEMAEDNDMTLKSEWDLDLTVEQMDRFERLAEMMPPGDKMLLAVGDFEERKEIEEALWDHGILELSEFLDEAFDGKYNEALFNIGYLQ